MEKSLTDYGYEALKASERSLSFQELANEIARISGMTQDEMRSSLSKLYTRLSLDHRFKVFPNNTWDLSERHAFSAVSYETLNKDAIEKQKEKEALEKFQKKIENARMKFNSLMMEARRKNLDVNNEETVIGWLAKHTTTISAEIPDFLKDSFLGQFGQDTPVTIVNTETKSIGGFVKKWGFSGSISVDSLDTMPPVLSLKFKDKKLNDSRFILNLIYNYGFKFGKVQDISEIKRNITNEEAFNLGYNA